LFKNAINISDKILILPSGFNYTMHNQFRALSLSYKNSPLEIREQVALNEASCRKLLSIIKEYLNINDVFVLSTCNRTEIYYSSEQDLSREIIKLLCLVKEISTSEAIESHFQIIDDQQEAITHLFEVSMGLDAQVVGDMQISNQVKMAYQWTADAGLAGPFLHRLLHTIFFTNKRVMQETSFRDGAASVSYATVELIEELTSGFDDPKILVLGLGEIGADVCRNFQNTSFKKIKVCNRTFEKAVEIANECGIEAVPFEEAWKHILDADVVISSIFKNDPFITKVELSKADRFTYKFLVDLSVPRSIESAVEEIPGVLLYNVDNIRNKATEALAKRIASIPKVRSIVKESIAEFNDWSKEMMVSPTINKLKNALEQIRQEEVGRYLKELNEEEAKKVEIITKNIMQKVMKVPVLQLKAACKRGEAETLIDILNDLFDLEKQKADK